jgi:hypothetical protein
MSMAGRLSHEKQFAFKINTGIMGKITKGRLNA